MLTVVLALADETCRRTGMFVDVRTPRGVRHDWFEFDATANASESRAGAEAFAVSRALVPFETVVAQLVAERERLVGERCTPDRVAVFSHVPKTGGWALRRALQTAQPELRVARAMPCARRDCRLNQTLGEDGLEGWVPNDDNDLRNALAASDRVLLWSHVHLHVRRLTFVVVREPFARALSAYHHLASTSLLGALADPELCAATRCLDVKGPDETGLFKGSGLLRCEPSEWADAVATANYSSSDVLLVDCGAPLVADSTELPWNTPGALLRKLRLAAGNNLMARWFQCHRRLPLQWTTTTRAQKGGALAFPNVWDVSSYDAQCETVVPIVGLTDRLIETAALLECEFPAWFAPGTTRQVARETRYEYTDMDAYKLAHRRRYPPPSAELAGYLAEHNSIDARMYARLQSRFAEHLESSAPCMIPLLAHLAATSLSPLS